MNATTQIFDENAVFPSALKKTTTTTTKQQQSTRTQRAALGDISNRKLPKTLLKQQQQPQQQQPVKTKVTRTKARPTINYDSPIEQPAGRLWIDQAGELPDSDSDDLSIPGLEELKQAVIWSGDYVKPPTLHRRSRSFVLPKMPAPTEDTSIDIDNDDMILSDNEDEISLNISF